jgi:aldose 1-epimerase
MAFKVTSRVEPEVVNRDGTVIVLAEDTGTRAEIWPALGFNAFRWQIAAAGGALDLLYAAPDLFTEGRPTRSGFPILFPFPGRIREGYVNWEGKEYQLERNDPTGKNASHGFACRSPWRVVAEGTDASSAWVTGVFCCSLDAPACLPLWPADHEIRLTYRLRSRSLRIEAQVSNPSNKVLPFGLGYHPYFRIPFKPGVEPEACTVQVPARSYWVLQDSIPTGERQRVDASRDLGRPRPFAGVQIDDVLTDLPHQEPDGQGLVERGVIHCGDVVLRLRCSPGFREMVVYTPPHRQAVCIEPYTCTTNAIFLHQHGSDAGWLGLPPGGQWSSVVELSVEGP